ncbi:MAG: TrkH family potassium uptake protein [Bacilli bacterium]|jgi:trk system potassium uptake protein TrkH
MTKRKTSPYLIILLSYLFIILIGACLFLLPISTVDNKGLGVFNSIFTATSAICVTGLPFVPNLGATLSLFGKIVLAVLIEIGGLGFLTLAVFMFILLGLKIGMAERFLMKEALNQNTAKGVIRLIKVIIITTLTIQFFGMLINLIVFINDNSFFKALGLSAFHSISSFNNAGFDIFGFDNSMINYGANILLNINTMLLVILGGIGFIVIHDILDAIRKKDFKKLPRHTKIVLIMSFSLILFGMILFKVSMYKDITWLEALFQSVNARSAGFFIIDISKISAPAYVILIFLMFIGASPTSTGGGIKTTTLFVLIATIISYARGKSPKIFSRRISQHSILKAFSLVVFAMLYIMAISFIILLIEKDLGVSETVFEVVSAFSTVGLSLGITNSLSVISKVLICITMLFGRLGPLTVISIWNQNRLRELDEDIKYIEEKIIIG